MQGIHAVLTKPIEIHTALWDPSDPVQSGMVLGWLWALYEGDVSLEVDPGSRALHLGVGDLQVTVPPGYMLGLDPESGFAAPFKADEFEKMFDYSHCLSDPNQPTIFD